MNPPPLPTAAKKNVQTVTELERELLAGRSRVEQVGEAIAGFFGSFGFIVAHAFALAVWVALNAAFLQQPFDPYPFPLLGLMVGIEFIFLTTFVLMNQALQARRQEKWSQVTLQLAILAEQEVTKNMQMLHLICKHLGLEQSEKDREVADLARATLVSTLVEEIDHKLDP